MRFSGVGPTEIVVREADGLKLVYHRTSGETHVLAPELLTVLEAIAGASLDLDGVISRLEERFDLEAEGGQVRDSVASRIRELISLGLADAR